MFFVIKKFSFLINIETRIVPRFAEFIKNQIENSEYYSFKDAGMTEEKLLEAAGSYILEIITRSGFSLSPYICTKDPTDLEYTILLSKIFPTAKFILMIRDARATVLSVNIFATILKIKKV